MPTLSTTGTRRRTQSCTSSCRTLHRTHRGPTSSLKMRSGLIRWFICDSTIHFFRISLVLLIKIYSYKLHHRNLLIKSFISALALGLLHLGLISPCLQVKRLGFDLSGVWRICTSDYQMCPTYPRRVIVPASINDKVSGSCVL